MSPYCPTCLGVSGNHEVRCPLDQQFLRRRSCQECETELFPREIYCAHCGTLNREPEEVLLLPPEAPWRRQVAGLLLDYLTFGIMLFIVVLPWNMALAFVLFPVGGVVYRALGRSGGRQTFGQAVFKVTTVSPQAGPATITSSLSRSLHELFMARFLFSKDTSVERELETRSGCLEVSLA